MTALPTRKDEAWRYSDLAAVAAAWPVAAPERIAVAAGERLTRTLIRTGGGTSIEAFDVEVGAGAAAVFVVLAAGTGYGRVAIDVTLADGAQFELGGVILGRGDATNEIVTTVRHAGPGATSRQTVRTVLDERATGSFLGKVAVARAAQKTDASQSVKALLLSRTATANAKPELEIFADDVKCAHGATVGELDRDALFYLESRGIGPAEARALLTQAFVAAAFDHAADPVARDTLTAAAAAWWANADPATETAA